MAMKKQIRAGLLLAGLLAPSAVLAQALLPYQQTGSANAAQCANNQCIISFAAVPAGKRLVLASLSAQLGPVSGPVVLEGNGATYFVPKHDMAIGYIASPMTFYYGPGQKPTARLFVPAGSAGAVQSTSIIVTLVGILVPAQ